MYRNTISRKSLHRLTGCEEKELDIINLGIGSPDQPPSENTVSALIAEARKPTSHGYQSYTGIPALEKSICRLV